MSTFCKIRKNRENHFRNRLMERFAIDYNEEEIKPFIYDVLNGDNHPLVILPNGNSFHRITLAGQEIIALFDWEATVFVTVYRTSWFTKDSEGRWIFKDKKTKSQIKKKNKTIAYIQKIKSEQKFINSHSPKTKTYNKNQNLIKV